MSALTARRLIAIERDVELTGTNVSSAVQLDDWLASDAYDFVLPQPPELVENELSRDNEASISSTEFLRSLGTEITVEEYITFARQAGFSDTSIEDALRSMPTEDLNRFLRDSLGQPLLKP